MVIEIPLINGSQNLTFVINSDTYVLNITWRSTTFGLVTNISFDTNYLDSEYGQLTGNYYLDIFQDNAFLVSGIMLVTGTDLLYPFAYLNIPGKWYIVNDDLNDELPTYSSLGQTSHLLVSY